MHEFNSFLPPSLCVRLLLPFASERRFQLAGEHLGWIYPCSVRNFPEQRIWLAFFFFFFRNDEGAEMEQGAAAGVSVR